MIIRKNAYFDIFRCIASACPDSCCQEWDVAVDDHSAAFYRNLPGDLGEALRQKLKFDDGWYLEITDRRCPMWRPDGLCRIQYELGENALCKTCREFPRLTHDYGDFVEHTLELSCPEAARILLTEPDLPMAETEVPGGEAPEYDAEIMDILLRSRRKALSLLENTPMPQALTLLLLYAYRIQDELDGGEAVEFDPEAELAFARQMGQKGNADSLREFYLSLEILTERWEHLLRHPAPHPHWPGELRRLAQYGVERYWLQAVSDYDLICRVKLILSACILVKELGGDPAATAQLWSKEIENSAENVDAILDAAYTSPAMTDVHLLGLLVR